MWVRVEKIDRKRRKAFGLLNNDPLFCKNIKYGDTIEVMFDEIVDINTPATTIIK